jgi:hypothetical protein
MSTDRYFEATGSYPDSLEYIDYNKATTVRCGPCGGLNPNFVYSQPRPKLAERARFKPPLDTEIIEIQDSPINPRSAPPTGDITVEQGIKSTRRRGLATYIPSLPDLKLGYAEKNR